jgi:hypothetical protein
MSYSELHLAQQQGDPFGPGSIEIEDDFNGAAARLRPSGNDPYRALNSNKTTLQPPIIAPAGSRIKALRGRRRPLARLRRRFATLTREPTDALGGVATTRSQANGERSK